ncbi:MAG: M20/M25/M40 family metallo-hydrolase [Saprospiraceae bacterium]|nr:M20/M25/M40 family metallo-hydrolase [Saprospiraceae bacterium]
MKKRLFYALLLFVLTKTHAQTLSKIEQDVLKSVDANMASTLQLLKESVNINSGTFNVKGVKAVADMYAKELRALGFTVEWLALPDSLKRAGHLVAYKKGKKGKKLFLIGHLDTVFEPDMPPNPFTMLNDSTATGQGVNDMKGGDVMMIAAMKALQQNGLLDDVSITIYMTGDEENAGHPREVSRGDFIARAKQHNIALGYETAVGMGLVATARRGASGWQLTVEGKQGHSSGVFAAGGYGAIYEAARILNEFRETLSTQPYLTFNPGLFLGGSEVNYHEHSQSGEAAGKTNIISPKTVVLGDLRFLSEEQKEKARDTMRQIVARNLAGTKASISFQDGIPSMPPTKGNENLAQWVNQVSLDLGYGEVKAGNPGSRGAGDISYVAQYLDCLDGLGASGKGAHAPGETINLNEYPKLIKRSAILIYRLTR